MARSKVVSSNVLLAIGAGLGAVIAAIGILQKEPPRDVPSDTVAVVNGVHILRADYDRAFAALSEALKKADDGVEKADVLRQRALDRLIDEELLVQRGIELGLPERDPQIRTQLSARVIEMVTMVQNGDPVPDDQTLRAFYEKDPDRFKVSGRYRVNVIFYAVPTDASSEHKDRAKRRADEAYARIEKGERFEDVRSSGDPLIVVVPDTPLPVGKLQDYLGASATRAVVELPEGHTSPPIRGADGYRILRLLESVDGETPAFETIRKDVENAYRKQQEDTRLQQFLERRRAAAKITIAP